MIRPRYFIETKDHLFFAVNSYTHPNSHIIAFLRYIPTIDGDRELDGRCYQKLNSEEAYEYLDRNYPDYLFSYNIENKKMMGIPTEDILRIHSPITRLGEIISKRQDNEFYEKVATIADIFHEKADINYDNMGITGSTLIGLERPNSDIDFVVFGLKNHYRARMCYDKLKNDESSPFMPIEGDFWQRLYNKRIKDDSLTFDEFVWYEKRKNNRGIIDNTLFDILSTMNDEEISSSDNLSYRQIGKIVIKCRISDAKQSFDTPSIYQVADVTVLSGPCVNIKEVVSYTHTYAGEVIDNERAIVSGVCEEVVHNESGDITYQVVVGSTRESINEYIKLDK